MSERSLEKIEIDLEVAKDNLISKIRDRLPPNGHRGPEFCKNCSDDMPEVRRVHGFDLCVDCKTIAEKSHARR